MEHFIKENIYLVMLAMAGLGYLIKWLGKPKMEQLADIMTGHACGARQAECSAKMRAQFRSGDETMTALSDAMAFTLRTLVKLCRAVIKDGNCEKIEAEAEELADALMRAGKQRARQAGQEI
jgi:hypothetical protein